MKKGQVVYSEEFGRGVVDKTSPSKSLVSVKFRHYGVRTLLSSSIQIVK